MTVNRNARSHHSDSVSILPLSFSLGRRKNAPCWIKEKLLLVAFNKTALCRTCKEHKDPTERHVMLFVLPWTNSKVSGWAEDESGDFICISELQWKLFSHRSVCFVGHGGGHPFPCIDVQFTLLCLCSVVHKKAAFVCPMSWMLLQIWNCIVALFHSLFTFRYSRDT